MGELSSNLYLISFLSLVREGPPICSLGSKGKGKMGYNAKGRHGVHMHELAGHTRLGAGQTVLQPASEGGDRSDRAGPGRYE